jgi:eukaryotic-like serine/threonine-protein kinase
MENPKRIGKYEFEEFLGGGMSHVYRARDTVIGRTVAVKILTQAGVADPEAKARFLREAQMAGSLSHENIMSVYDFGEDEGQPFMVMEFLRGEDLRSAMKNGHTGDIKARLKIAVQAAKALEYIHQQKIIHRDIKPENIHINTNGSVKLMDFGVAKTDELSLTRPGFTMGTPYYMAPEQVVGRDVTHLADIYSFGMFLYELLAETRAIGGDTIEQLFYKILNEPVNIAPLRQAGIPESVCGLIEKCIAKNPAERPQSMSAVRLEIEKALENVEPTPRPKPLTPSRPKWLIPAVAAIAILLAVAVGLFFSMRDKNETDSTNAPPVKKAEPSPVLSTSTGEMVLIPAGAIPAFYMDRTEVTNEAYARFCAERQKPLPSEFPKDRPNYPVVNITIVDAKEFAKWAQKRLPSKLEWDTAARGSDKRAYPWGNSHDPSYANVLDNTELKEHMLMPVDSFKQGASPYGVLQMAGNVWEFVDELVSTPSAGAIKTYAEIMSTAPPTADEPWYTTTGGSYEAVLIKDAAFEWSAVPARYRASNIGFRCVKDIQ